MTRPVRIASRLFSPEVAAAAFRLRVLSDAFDSLGHPVEVLTTTPPGDLVADDGELRVSRWPALRDEQGNIRGYLHYLSFDLPLAMRLLVRRRPVLLVCEPPPTTGLVVRVAAAIQRVPYAYYAGDVWSDGAASMGAPAAIVRVLRAVESWVMRGASSVLCISDGVAERVAHLGVEDSRIVVVGNGVDTDVFTPVGPGPEALPPGGGGPLFVYTGTMSEWQGAEVLVRAFAAFRAAEPSARLVFLGQGSDVPHLRRLAEQLVPGAVDFRGVVPPAHAAAWLRAATAALVSIRPGQGYDFAKPTKVYAATACGTPVIFSGAGAGHELVESQRLGWAPGYDVAGVTRAMASAWALTDDERARTQEHVVAWTEDHASLQTMGRLAAEAALRGAGLA
ncbi:glycosyltransferase family 4 protein [Pedococcus sp. KACC 23699]|uniref:D-inositol 3-phosphate glycosyltransferase n=1 Tax=Pedococcus sp. KACC 23699 TaxID=3149228 RepID=A0AAU7JW23_9MICO